MRTLASMRHGRSKTSKAALVAIALATVVSCTTRDARADDDAPSPPAHGGSPYRLRFAYDFSFLALGAAGSLTALIGYPPAVCPNPCVPPQKQLGIDDHFAGTRSGGAMTAANVLLGVTLAAPVVLDAVDSRFHGFAEDVVVMGESLALATAITQVIKSATGRLAPVVYSRDVRQSDLDNQDAARSFPSGHTAATFAVATSYAITFWKRNPHSPWRWVVLGVGQALALTTGMLTVAAGWHYPTDVAAGALTGGATGVLMPFLHTDW